MDANYLHIQKKLKESPVAVANISDFEYVEGEKIDDIKTIIYQPNISLYCLYPEKKQFIFVETSQDIDIFNTTFFYESQFKYAQRLIAVSYKKIQELSKEIVKNVDKLILIYSVGRCGSTLLSKVFKQLDNVVTLSEPDVFSQIVGLRKPDGSNADEIAELLLACTRFLCKTPQEEKIFYWAIKFRGFCIEIADIMYHLFPNAKMLFLYRNAEDVVKSCIRAFDPYMRSHLEIIQKEADFYTRFITLQKEYSDYIDYTDSTDLYSVRWLSYIHRYMLLYHQGINMCAVRYEDLVAHPEEIVSLIFQYCDLPIFQVLQGYRAFEEDSQAGSVFSRANTRKVNLSVQESLKVCEKVRSFLKKHPYIQTPDFVVPNTLILE